MYCIVHNALHCCVQRQSWFREVGEEKRWMENWWGGSEKVRGKKCGRWCRAVGRDGKDRDRLTLNSAWNHWVTREEVGGEKTVARFPNSLYTRRSGSLTRRIVTLQCIEHIRILTSLMEADASQVSHRCTSCIFLRTAHICLHLPFSSNACSSFVNSFTPATSIFLSSFNYQ